MPFRANVLYPLCISLLALYVVLSCIVLLFVSTVINMASGEDLFTKARIHCVRALLILHINIIINYN